MTAATAENHNVVKMPPATATKPVKPTKPTKLVKPAALTLEVGKIAHISPSLINVEEGLNPRAFNAADQADVTWAESIRAGVRKALEVRQDADGKIWLLDGHRRLGAVLYLQNEAPKKAVIATVPVVRVADAAVSDEANRAGHILMSASFKGLTPMESARLAKRMADDGRNVKVIASYAGKTPKYISMLLDLAKVPESVGRHIHMTDTDSGVAATLAYELVSEIGADRAAAAIEKALNAKAKTVVYGAPVRITRKDVLKFDPDIKDHKGATRSPQTPTAGETKPTEAKPAETTPAAGETKPAETKSSETTPAAGETTPAASGEVKPTAEKTVTVAGHERAPADPGAKPLTRVTGFNVVWATSGKRFATFTSSALAEYFAKALETAAATMPANLR